MTYLGEHGTDVVLELQQLSEPLLHDAGEGQEAQGVTRGGRVKDHHREVHTAHQSTTYNSLSQREREVQAVHQSTIYNRGRERGSGVRERGRGRGRG